MIAASRMNTRKANRRVRFLNSASISALLFGFIGGGVPVVTESVPRDGSDTLLSNTALMDGLSLVSLRGRAEGHSLARGPAGPARRVTTAGGSYCQTALPSALLIWPQAARISSVTLSGSGT